MSRETPSFIPITRPHLPAGRSHRDRRGAVRYPDAVELQQVQPAVPPALESCVDLAWQKVLPGCVHGYKDLAVEFLTAEHRSAAETALAAVGVMTKRSFFPIHRMEAYRGHALRRLPVTDDLHDRLLCIPI